MTPTDRGFGLCAARALPSAASEIPSPWALTRPAWTHSRGGSLQRPQDVTEAGEPRIVIQRIVIRVEPVVDDHVSTLLKLQAIKFGVVEGWKFIVGQVQFVESLSHPGI